MDTLGLDFLHKWYEEGKVRFIAPVFPTTKIGEPQAPTKAQVFYNPFSKISRDMTVLLIRTHFQKLVKVAEPLAGSGIRGIRLLVENNNVKVVYMNDINANACKVMRINAENNNVADRVIISNQEANIFLTRYSLRDDRFDYVDIDPVGAPVRFVENSLRACVHEGVVGVSATDLASLTGAKPSACIRKYDAIPLHSPFSKEIAIRIMLGFIARAAARINAGIIPLFSFYHRHFIRVFVKLMRGRSKARMTLQNLGWVKYCPKCMSLSSSKFSEIPSAGCGGCGGDATVAGPLWIGRMADGSLANRMLEEADMGYGEASKLLRKIVEEDTEIIGFYTIPSLARLARTSPISPRELIARLRESGYRATITHVEPNGVKTNAPLSDVIKFFKRD